MNEPAKPAICLFAHYAPDRRLSASVLHYLAELVRCGLAVHVALSGTDRVAPEDREILDRLGIAAYPRPNAGLDFGAWQHLFRIGCAKNAGSVLLANDSVFGPVSDLPPIVRAMQARNYDVWGMVESHELSWHLQSWFIFFSAAALARPAIARVFEQPFEQMSKAEIVLHGEIGLGTAIKTENLSWGACLPDTRRGLRKLVAANPMHVDWIFALRSGRVPFIKAELLRDNPARIPWLERWPKVLARTRNFPESWIRERITPVGPGSCASSLRMRLVYVLLTRDRPAALRALFFPPRGR
jgi:lipopolysaccharide biosynthesis protein